MHTNLNRAPASYITRAERRIRAEADKIITHYSRGLLTFDEFINMLQGIEDARIYEEEAAKDD